MDCKHGLPACRPRLPHIFWWRRDTFSPRHLQNAQVYNSPLQPRIASWFIAPHNTNSDGLFAGIFTYLYNDITGDRKPVVERKKKKGGRTGKYALWPRKTQQTVTALRIDSDGDVQQRFGHSAQTVLTSNVRISFCVKSLDVAHLVRKPSKLEMLISIIFCTNSHCCKAFCKLRCCSSLFVISSFIVFANSGRYFPRCTFKRKKERYIYIYLYIYRPINE